MIVAALIVETSPPLPSSPVLYRVPLILAMVTAIGSDPAPRVLLAINAMQLPPSPWAC